MLTLSQAYGNYKKSRKEGYKNDVATGTALSVVLILILLQLAFAIFAIYCLIHCSHLLPVWATILLGVLLFVPDAGMLVAIGIIIYYFVSCRAGGDVRSFFN